MLGDSRRARRNRIAGDAAGGFGPHLGGRPVASIVVEPAAEGE